MAAADRERSRPQSCQTPSIKHPSRAVGKDQRSGKTPFELPDTSGWRARGCGFHDFSELWWGTGFLGICSGTNPLLLLLRSLTPTGETPFFAVLGPFRRGVRAQCASIPFQPFPRKTCMRRSDCGRHGTGQDQHWDGPRNHVAGRPGNDSHCPLRPSTLQDFIKLGYTDWMDSKTFICA